MPDPTLELTVYGHAEPAGSKRGFARGGRVVVADANPKSREWKDRVAQAAGEQCAGSLLEGPLIVEMCFYMPRPRGHLGTGRNASRLRAGAPAHPITRPDALKLARGAEDALTGVVWRDDSQIVVENLEKRYGEPARCVVRVWKVPNTNGGSST